MSRNCCIGAAARSVMRPSGNGRSNSGRCSPIHCVSGNPDGVPAGIRVKSVPASLASDLGCSWPERTRLSTPCRWRTVDEHGFVLDILLQRHRDTEAPRTCLTRLLGEYDVSEVIHIDQLRSYGAAIREIPSLSDVDHQQVISTARCNNLIEQSHRLTRRQERQQLGFKRRKRAQAFLNLQARIENLHHHTRTSVPAMTRRHTQKKTFRTWSTVVAGGV